MAKRRLEPLEWLEPLEREELIFSVIPAKAGIQEK